MEHFSIQGIPVIVCGEPSDKVFLFIHGKNGNKEEAEPFASAAARRGCQVLGFDLPGHGERQNETDAFDPWHVIPEFKAVLSKAKDRWPHISIRANSIGAYFSMLSCTDEPIERCLFVSPILDMERLITNMMNWSGVTEAQLEEQKLIPTAFGETLSWEYLSYVRKRRIGIWNAPTSILYGSADNLTERETVDAFVKKHKCRLTVMAGGEHWFHTPEQLEVLNRWEKESIE
jgi:alpha-beta hydrolase superfamily lysophospholipase